MKQFKRLIVDNIYLALTTTVGITKMMYIDFSKFLISDNNCSFVVIIFYIIAGFVVIIFCIIAGLNLLTLCNVLLNLSYRWA
jgi:hypothetical protein